ncbi:hypothetical protein L195_g058316, partial [Trifolium pratense]
RQGDGGGATRMQLALRTTVFQIGAVFYISSFFFFGVVSVSRFCFPLGRVFGFATSPHLAGVESRVFW